MQDILLNLLSSGVVEGGLIHLSSGAWLAESLAGVVLVVEILPKKSLLMQETSWIEQRFLLQSETKRCNPHFEYGKYQTFLVGKVGTMHWLDVVYTLAYRVDLQRFVKMYVAVQVLALSLQSFFHRAHIATVFVQW